VSLQRVPQKPVAGLPTLACPASTSGSMAPSLLVSHVPQGRMAVWVRLSPSHHVPSGGMAVCTEAVVVNGGTSSPAGSNGDTP